MTCCEQHGVNCNQGRTCPRRLDPPLFAPEDGEGWAWLLELFFVAITVFCVAMVVWHAIRS